MSSHTPEPDTDAMICCNRHTCRHNCEEKQSFCTRGSIFIDESGSCTCYERDEVRIALMLSKIRNRTKKGRGESSRENDLEDRGSEKGP